jgi:hypothetical protein
MVAAAWQQGRNEPPARLAAVQYARLPLGNLTGAAAHVL